MIDEKNFLFSGIKLEYKDQYKILNDQRSLPNEANPLENMINKYGKILLGSSIAIILVPTLVLFLIEPSYNLFVWILVEIGLCITAIDHFTHRFALISSEIQVNHTSEQMISTLMSQYELHELEILAKEDFEEKNQDENFLRIKQKQERNREQVRLAQIRSEQEIAVEKLLQAKDQGWII